MKKNMKIFKKTIKTFSILFLTVISSLFFVSRTKAVSSAPVSSKTIKYFSDYNNIYVNNSKNQENNLPRFYNLFEANKKDYPYYMILYYENKFHLYVFDKIPNYYLYYYIATDNSPRQMFYNQYDAAPTFKYRDVTTGNTLSDEKTMSWNTIYSTDSYASVVVFDSNFPIQIIGGYNTCGGCSGRKGIDLQIDNLYYTYGDIIPTYSDIYPEIKKKYYNPISIDMSIKKNTVNANNKEYVLSEDLTITYNVDDYTKYIYQFKKLNDEDWTNVGLVNSNSITLNITKNDTIYARILDRTDEHNVVTVTTMTITNINYDEYIKDNINISFGIKNNYANGTENIISKDLTIKYNVDDYKKYIYLYKKESDSNWSTHTFISNNTSLTLNVTYNTTYIARILDKKTNDVLSTSTFTITGISDFNTLKLVKTFNSGTNGDDLYSLNITNSSNHDIPFKIQFGSNDFSSKYVPRISGIKGYIYNPTTQQKKDGDLVNIKDFKCYKEIEGDTEVWCTGVLSKPQGSSAYYQIIFENTDNYYLYYYDSFSNSDRSLDITTNLFKDYNKYRFNSNSNKAYIYLKNKGQANTKGSVIIPYYYLNNDDLSVKLLKYNRNNNTYGDEYSSYFIGDNYYKEIPFTVDENTVPVLTNKKNQRCESYIFDGNNNSISDITRKGVLTYIGTAVTLSPFVTPFIYDKVLTTTECYQEEPVYFYVHKDFKVSFNTIDEDKNSTSDVVISDDNGNIFFDIDKDSDNTDVYKEENKNFFDMVKESFNYFTSPLSEFLNMFTHFWNGLNIIIKYFIVFIFVFILALFILRFIL